MTDIPRQFHFVFGLKPQTGPFHIAHYLCLASCMEVNRPERVFFHYHHEPYGPWWDHIRPRLSLCRVQPEAFVTGSRRYLDHQEGRFIKSAGLDYAHQADFLRLRVLLEHGGVYADMDTLFVRPYPDSLYRHSFVLGAEDPVCIGGATVPSLCNAVILARAGARFGRVWLDDMYHVFDGSWSRHSCAHAAELAARMPAEIYVAPQRYFYRYMWTREGIADLFERLDGDVEDVYSIHLWSHLWWEAWRTDFSRFHGGLLTEQYIRTVDTTYNVLARRFLP